ncbi:MAG: hypothetical protein IPM35_41695 [Myxococcales bacterium]|nr:hypothetical protein [Myxococcales bacterium]
MQERRALWAISLLGCLGVYWAISSVPLVLTNDGPEAVLTAHMEAHYDDPDSIFARQYSVGFGLSGRGFSVLYRLASLGFSWPASLRVSQWVVVASLAVAVIWLTKAVSGAPRFVSLLGFAIAFSWPFYMGFFAFAVSMAVGLMVLAFVVGKSGGLTRLEKAAVSTALLVQLFLHGFAVFISLALVAMVVLTRALMRRQSEPRRAWRRATLLEIAWLVATTLPSVAVLLWMRAEQAQLATISASGQTEWASASEWIRILPRLAVPGSTPLGLVVFALAATGIARTALRLRRSPRRPEEVALFIGALALLLAALGLPLNVPGWQFFAPRFLTTGLALALSLLGLEEPARKPVRLAAGLGVVGLVATCLANATALHRRLATACEDAISGLAHRVPRSAYQLPITFDASCGLEEDNVRREVPYSTPLLHFYALFPVTHGGTVPYGFVGPAAVHAFVPRASSPVPVPAVERYWGLSRHDPRLSDPKQRAALLTDLALFGSFYENMLFFGAAASDRALLLERGYVIDFEQGSFVNARHVPCLVEVETSVLPSDPPIMVRGGLGDDELWTAKIVPIENRRTITASLATLCGDVWVRVQWQGSDAHCANADARGRLALTATRQTTRVVCQRDPRP